MNKFSVIQILNYLPVRGGAFLPTMNKRIAVIVPVYNVEKYLSRCIDSIINQTYHDLQIILVDDGSTDNSGRICDSYKCDSRVQVIHQPNGGSVRSRKAGLKEVQAEYVAFVDSDDYIEENMYEELLTLAIKTEADFVHAPYFIETLNGVSDNSKTLEEGCVEITDETRVELIHRNLTGVIFPQRVIPGICSKIYKRELAEKCFSLVPDNQQLGDDDIFQCACLLEASKFYITTKPYYHYVFRQKSLSKTRNEATLSGRLGEYLALENLFKKYDYEKELYEANKVLLIYQLFACVPDIIEIIEKKMNIALYLPNEERFLGKKIAIWGCGKEGKACYKQLKELENCSIMAWIDNNQKNGIIDGVLINSFEDKVELLRDNCDFIVIAVKTERTASAIKEQCLKYGISEDKVVWEKLVYKSIE